MAIYKGTVTITLEQTIVVEADNHTQAEVEVEKKMDRTNYKVLSGPYFTFLEALCYQIREEYKHASEDRR